MKPFTAHGYTFLPCGYRDSLDQGYRWYAVVTHRSGLDYEECQSPRFRTKADCLRYAAEQARADAIFAAQNQE